MRSLLVAVMAALLLGLVVGLPVRVSAVEETVSMAREQGVLNEAWLVSFLEGFLGGLLSFGGGLVSMVFSMMGGGLLIIVGLPLTLLCGIGLPVMCIGGVVLALGVLAGICGVMCAVPAGIVTSIITFPGEIILSIESFPFRLVNWIVWNLRRLCVPF